MRHDRKLAAACVLVFAGTMAATGSVRADDNTAPGALPAAPDSADLASKYLGSAYRDEKAGFKVVPPAGSKVMHGAGLELMTFVQDEKQWGGTVQDVTLKDKSTVQDFLQSCVADLGKTFKGVQVLGSSEITFQKHKAGLLNTSMEANVGAARGPQQMLSLFRQQLVVQVADNEFMVLTLYSALKDRTEATATFQAMVGAFEILDRTQTDKRRLEGIQAGKAWLAERTAEELKEKLSVQPQLFRMKVSGKDVGYIRFDEMETERDGSKGVMVVASSRGWLLDPNVGLPLVERTKILKSVNLAYWAFSRDEKTHDVRDGYSTWENSTATTAYVVKGKDRSGRDLPREKYEFWVKEAGILIEQRNCRLAPADLDAMLKERNNQLKRKDLEGLQLPPPIQGPQKVFHLIVNFTGDPTQALQEHGKGVDVAIPEYREAVLPKVLEYTWPRLVDLKKPSRMVFAVYNSVTRKMNDRIFTVVGPESVVLDGKRVQAVKCTDEMEDAGTTMWVDSSGRILKMLTSDQTLLEPTTEDRMKRLWGDHPQG